MIRGNKQPIHNKELSIELGLHNRFDIEVLDASTGEVRKRACAFNVICDNLWNVYLQNNDGNYFKYIHYGDGEGTPSSSDTQLFSLVGYKEVTGGQTQWDRVSGVYARTQQIQLNASDAVGETLTEVGVAYGTAASTLCTHAMLKDMNGNPISIVKTDLDVINIYATIFVHYRPEGYEDGSIFIMNYSSWGNSLLQGLAGVYRGSGVYLGRVMYGKYPQFNKASSAGELLLNGSSVNSTASRSVDMSKKTLTLTAPRLNTGDMNMEGIRAILISSYYHSSSYWNQYMYPALVLVTGRGWYPNSRITDEPVGSGDGATKDFKLNFEFAKNLTLYIDGNEYTEVSVEYAPNTADNWELYMEYLHPDSTEDLKIPYYFASRNQSTVDKVYYNPMHEIGVSKISGYKAFNLYASNNLIDWELLGSGTRISIPEAYVHYKYWKHEELDPSGGYLTEVLPVNSFTGKTLHLLEAPPEGSVITASYDCDCIAKDADHVFDMSVTLHFGEYAESQ